MTARWWRHEWRRVMGMPPVRMAIVTHAALCVALLLAWQQQALFNALTIADLGWLALALPWVACRSWHPWSASQWARAARRSCVARTRVQWAVRGAWIVALMVVASAAWPVLWLAAALSDVPRMTTLAWCGLTLATALLTAGVVALSHRWRGASYGAWLVATVLTVAAVRFGVQWFDASGETALLFSVAGLALLWWSVA